MGHERWTVVKNRPILNLVTMESTPKKIPTFSSFSGTAVNLNNFHFKLFLMPSCDRYWLRFSSIAWYMGTVKVELESVWRTEICSRIKRPLLVWATRYFHTTDQADSLNCLSHFPADVRCRSLKYAERNWGSTIRRSGSNCGDLGWIFEERLVGVIFSMLLVVIHWEGIELIDVLNVDIYLFFQLSAGWCRKKIGKFFRRPRFDWESPTSCWSCGHADYFDCSCTQNCGRAWTRSLR